ncbi:hypothetical protein H012_gp639 [Acanthamoeba polyphaga moumouvirus]|uniref:Uncharacterized protein n=1 Tax=Acanthamoeba polyphaga moumouvirus TaxID=1269028 RepID=L7RBG3_9VIRU|nr:hypothetical protein H012_gp639 [Acanthamoeba polyphaga moumouvirus]AGC01824.1 hypothetical protein Moumou_00284 [Acanthamoeba polyphaga moumouvirus]AQN68181.1 hypothetical protein [Saudi moumouvirus]
MDNFNIYYESKYEAGSCIRRNRILFGDDKIAINNNFTKLKINDEIIYPKYIKTKLKKGKYNVGGIIGYTEAYFITRIFQLSQNQYIYIVYVSTMDQPFKFDHIKYNNKEYRLNNKKN